MREIIYVPSRLGDVIDRLIEVERIVSKNLSDKARARTFRLRANALERLRERIGAAASSERMIPVDVVRHGWAVSHALDALIGDEEEAHDKLIEEGHTKYVPTAKRRLADSRRVRDLIIKAARKGCISLRAPRGQA